jgi:hypothetical protein
MLIFLKFILGVCDHNYTNTLSEGIDTGYDSFGSSYKKHWWIKECPKCGKIKKSIVKI